MTAKDCGHHPRKFRFWSNPKPKKTSQTEAIVSSSSAVAGAGHPRVATNKQLSGFDLCHAASNNDVAELQRLVEGVGSSVPEPVGSWFPALHWAANNNSAAAAQYIIAHGGDVNAVDDLGQTALHWGANTGAIQVADLLLQEGARVDATNKHGSQAVHLAAKSGQTAFLHHIVTKWKADHDVPENDGRSPLHSAACFGYVDCIRLLLSWNAYWGHRDKEGHTPLHCAAMQGHLEACKVLVEAGTKDDLLLIDNDGHTPSQLAAKNNHKEVAFFLGNRSLFDVGVDVVKSRDREASASTSTFAAAGGGDGGIAANKEPLSDDVYTAVGYGDMEKLQRLVECEGRSVSKPDGSGFYALQWAALNNHTAVAQYIIVHGGDVNAADHTGQTALHWSAVWGAIPVAELLLQEGAQVDATDMCGHQIAHVAARYGQTAYLHYIVTKWNADHDMPDNDGRSPLHWAAFKGFADCIHLLLSLDAYRVRQDRLGCTPLHWAAIKGHLEACTVLVQAGTIEDLMLTDNTGLTPAQLAADTNHREVAIFLDKNIKQERTKSVSEDCIQIIKNSNLEELQELDSGYQSGNRCKNGYDKPSSEHGFAVGCKSECDKPSSKYASGHGSGNVQKEESLSSEYGFLDGRKPSYGGGYAEGSNKPIYGKPSYENLKGEGSVKPSYLRDEDGSVKPSYCRDEDRSVKPSYLRDKDGSAKPSYCRDEDGSVKPSYHGGEDDGGCNHMKNVMKVKLERTNFLSSGMGRLQIIKNADLEELWELGSGAFGIVSLGKWRGTDVAIKRINKRCFSGKPSEKERMIDDFLNEAIKLSELHHPNVVAFYGVVLDGPGDSVATVTEYMADGSLRTALQHIERDLDQRKHLLIAMDVAFGMEYLHSKNIVHFDLKCDNLLVNLWIPHKPICKVGDLGLSKVKCETLITGGVRGTLPWMAPELLNGRSPLVSEKVDVFSFGIVLWELLTGEEPYAGLPYWEIMGGIARSTLRPPVPENCDPDWRSLMERCWSDEPSERPSFTEISNELRAMAAKIPSKGQTSTASSRTDASLVC